ncbi:MAG: ankyrin repeat domain-containing protein [Bacteroidetes bacterium]|nr:ankyrin repeat domain-containing protein [Bacteroidota bacterium]
MFRRIDVMDSGDNAFNAALAGLRNGDFSRLAPLFDSAGNLGEQSRIVAWYERGLFADHPVEAAEALTCACFLGEYETAEYLISRGLDPSGGSLTGMNAVHWAANRGQLGTLRLLLKHRVPLETKNMYGGTVLEQTVWSAIHQAGPGQLEAIAELLRAGADVTAVQLPTGDREVDELLNRFRTT